jgi:hypothetical protein
MSYHLNKEFMDSIMNLFRKLHVVCRYSAPEAWLLVGCTSRHLWIHVKSLRAKAMGIDVGHHHLDHDAVSNCSQRDFGCGDGVSLGHHKEIIRFQLEHRVDESQIKAVETLVEGLRTQVKECNAATAKGKKATASLSEKVTKNSQEIGNLKNQVKAKGKKETP